MISASLVIDGKAVITSDILQDTTNYFGITVFDSNENEIQLIEKKYNIHIPRPHLSPGNGRVIENGKHAANIPVPKEKLKEIAL